MRVKSEAKLQQIVDVASRIFIEKGFDGTSMSEVSAALGGSKATLYNYFGSKAELFTEVMLQAAAKLKGKAMAALDLNVPIRAKLREHGIEHINFLLSPQMLDIRRTVLAELHKLNIGPEIYERGVKTKWQPLANVLEAAMQAGELKSADPWTAALQLRALFEVNATDLCMYQLKKKMTRAEIEQTVDNALELFFCYYGK
jgi:AcrR family transcriptional regulator